MMNKRLGSSECQRVNPSNLFANQVHDVKCMMEQMIVEVQSCCRATFATNIPSKVPMVVGTHSCCQIHRHSTMHPVEEKRAATGDRSGS